MDGDAGGHPVRRQRYPGHRQPGDHPRRQQGRRLRQVGAHAEVGPQAPDQRLGRAAAPVQLGEVDDRSVDVALEAHRVEQPLVERPERDHGVGLGHIERVGGHLVGRLLGQDQAALAGMVRPDRLPAQLGDHSVHGHRGVEPQHGEPAAVDGPGPDHGQVGHSGRGVSESAELPSSSQTASALVRTPFGTRSARSSPRSRTVTATRSYLPGSTSPSGPMTTWELRGLLDEAVERGTGTHQRSPTAGLKGARGLGHQGLLELEPQRQRPRLELHPLLGDVVDDVHAGRRLDPLQPLDLVAAALVERAVDLQLAGLARRTDGVEGGVAPVRELVLVEPLELHAHPLGGDDPLARGRELADLPLEGLHEGELRPHRVDPRLEEPVAEVQPGHRLALHRHRVPRDRDHGVGVLELPREVAQQLDALGGEHHVAVPLHGVRRAHVRERPVVEVGQGVHRVRRGLEVLGARPRHLEGIAGQREPRRGPVLLGDPLGDLGGAVVGAVVDQDDVLDGVEHRRQHPRQVAGLVLDPEDAGEPGRERPVLPRPVDGEVGRIWPTAGRARRDHRSVRARCPWRDGSAVRARTISGSAPGGRSSSACCRPSRRAAITLDWATASASS